METKGKGLGGIILEGGIEGLVMSFIHSLGRVAVDTAKEHAGDFLKAKIGNLGTNDEYLFLSACSYAINDHKDKISSDELSKVLSVIDSYEKDQRKRIIGIIGKSEEDVTISSDKLKPDGTPDADKSGNVRQNKTTKKANVKGADFLIMLSKLDSDGMKKVLNTSGASDSFLSNVKEKVKSAVDTVENTQIKQDGDNFFTKETWLERKAREAKAKRSII